MGVDRLAQSLADKSIYTEKSVNTVAINKRAYVNNPLVKPDFNRVIEGYFPKENFVRDMAIKKINKTLCVLLGLIVLVSFASYYFVLSTELKLNELSRQTIMLNDENTELQNTLDKLKSFKNVDATMQKTNFLQKADMVIETPEISVNVNQATKKNAQKCEDEHGWIQFLVGEICNNNCRQRNLQNNFRQNGKVGFFE